MYIYIKPLPFKVLLLYLQPSLTLILCIFVCRLTVFPKLSLIRSWKSPGRVESEARARLPSSCSADLLCVPVSLVFAFSCLWLGVTFWHPGSECSTREWAAPRSEFKECTQRALPLIWSSWWKIQEVGLVFRKNEAEPVTQSLLTLILCCFQNVNVNVIFTWFSLTWTKKKLFTSRFLLKSQTPY